MRMKVINYIPQKALAINYVYEVLCKEIGTRFFSPKINANYLIHTLFKLAVETTAIIYRSKDLLQLVQSQNCIHSYIYEQ